MKNLFLILLALALAGFAYCAWTENKEIRPKGLELSKPSTYISEFVEYDKTWSYLLPYCKTYISTDFIRKLRDESVPAEKRFDKAFDSTPLVLFSLFQGGARRVFYTEEQRFTSDIDPNKYKVIPEFYIHYLMGNGNELIYKNPHSPMAVGYYHLQDNQTSLVAGNGSYTEKADIIQLDSSSALIKLRFGSDSLEFTGIDITQKLQEIRVKQEEIDHGYFVHLLDLMASSELHLKDSSVVKQYLAHMFPPAKL